MSFSFGTPSSAPATSSLSGGFSFGANKPATPGFGLAATTQSPGLFGTPTTSAPAFGASTLGSTSFGATTTPGFGAGTPAFGTGTPTFGAATPAFGAAPAPTFGSTPAFGATTSAPAFVSCSQTFATIPGAPASNTLTAAPFGATSTPSFGLGSGGLNFGAGTNTAAPTTGLSFGAPATTTATLGLGGFPTASAAPTLGFGAFGATTTTTNSFFGPKLGQTSVTGTLPSTSVTSSIGLGGVTSTGIGAANANADSTSEQPKQQKLPNEISTTVESFKEFVKKQKSLSSDVMRMSVKPLHTVSREAEATLRSAAALAGDTQRARATSRRLRAAAAAALAAADGAARDRAAGSSREGAAPPQCVKELVSELETQLLAFRRQMDVADKQMHSAPKLLTEQELNLGFRRMHESLVALAGRLQAVHTQVEAQKEQYLNLRRYVLKDPTDVFDSPSSTSALDQILKEVDGSRKKSKTSGLLDSSYMDTKMSGNHRQLSGPSPFNCMSGFTPFPIADTSAPSWQPQAPAVPTSFATESFTLQKSAGKRGKQ